MLQPLNRAARLETVTLEGGARIFVIDDFLCEPEALVALARAAAGRFQPVPGHPYPGPQLSLPQALSLELGNFFQQQMRARLGARAFLGMGPLRPRDAGGDDAGRAPAGLPSRRRGLAAR
jgi:hypothetical protein